MTSIVVTRSPKSADRVGRKNHRVSQSRRQQEVAEQLKIIAEIEANLAKPRSYFKNLRRKEQAQ
ncbi:hypothetical protein [Rothia nasimurium]|uniref:hypothetical protein n=1 Tax=Rothia nasimurium TaxID=85336 RepID=UPI002DD68067|nr:hypothetical protein [Rothia nasimurium]